jgi:DNA polymerase III epsilon subunit-like protein
MSSQHLDRFVTLYQSGARFVVFDVETVGTGDGTVVVEIGAVEAGRGSAQGARHWSKIICFQPQSWRPYASALRIHGIPPAEIERGAPRTESLKEFIEFAHGATLICHTNYDIRAMRADLTRDPNLHAYLRSPLWSTYLDSCQIARQAWPHLHGHSLTALSQHLAIPNPAAHRALADAITTKKVLARALGERLKSK